MAAVHAGQDGPDLAEVTVLRVYRLDPDPATEKLGVLKQFGNRVHGGHTGVPWRQLGHPVIAVAPGESGAERRPEFVLARIVGLVRDPLLQPERLAKVGEKGGLPSRAW